MSPPHVTIDAIVRHMSHEVKWLRQIYSYLRPRSRRFHGGFMVKCGDQLANGVDGYQVWRP